MAPSNPHDVEAPTLQLQHSDKPHLQNEHPPLPYRSIHLFPNQANHMRNAPFRTRHERANKSAPPPPKPLQVPLPLPASTTAEKKLPRQPAPRSPKAQPALPHRIPRPHRVQRTKHQTRPCSLPDRPDQPDLRRRPRVLLGHPSHSGV